MRRLMIQYRVKPDRVGDNEAAVQCVFDELRRSAPAGFRYGVFKLDDGLTFVHLVSLETADARNPLQSLAAFQAFTGTVKDRCDELPVSRPLREVASYRLFGAGQFAEH